ncbi:MBOAT family O-acyltransferase [Rhodocytophaga rosea]|uniref:MBOAT family O-acyltransferase n=1 Tax=Rhodocytophaga rosea TaxID=2704465 RepID=UPI001E447F77|nr:MBOAT family O-acyltransferase [Rhodocytophaga rosea]
MYRKEVNVQRNPFHLALYISLFPQLIAGPIIRYHDVDEQILKRDTTWEKFYDGFSRFFKGLGKKVLIANSMAMLADDIFKLPASDIPGIIAWLGIICYSLQIYFDFSGYSDMAIGLGKMFGFTFLENFNYPYISKSIQEFWRRWHISLSSWFRDYVYIPLGGSRRSQLITYRNLLTVFFLTGLWHGASWNFVVWGLFHGFFIILERIGLNSLLKKSYQPIQHLYALLVVIIGWVFFRAVDISYAVEYIQSMFGLNEGRNFSSLTYLDKYTLFMLGIGIIFSTPLRIYLSKQVSIFTMKYFTPRLHMFLENTFSYVFSLSMFLLSIIELAKSSYNPFIYFRF